MSSSIPESEVRLEEFFGFYTGSIGHYLGLSINQPLEFTPGSKYTYFSSNFHLAAYLLEKLCGEPLEIYFKKHIFDPIGMHHSYYDPYDGEYRVIKNLASQYMKSHEAGTMKPIATGTCRPDGSLGAFSGAGGIVSTVGDLAKWYVDFFGNYGNYGKHSKVLHDPAAESPV